MFFDKRVVKSSHCFPLRLDLLYAIAYVRVSTEEQTVLNQKMALQTWASEQGYQIIYYFEDSAVSGRTPAIKRKAFQEMLEFIKESASSMIFVQYTIGY